MTYSTKQLTEGLQKLAERPPEFQKSSGVPAPDPQRMELSPEIDRFIQRRREYIEKTRSVSLGSY